SRRVGVIPDWALHQKGHRISLREGLHGGVVRKFLACILDVDIRAGLAVPDRPVGQRDEVGPDRQDGEEGNQDRAPHAVSPWPERGERTERHLFSVSSGTGGANSGEATCFFRGEDVRCPRAGAWRCGDLPPAGLLFRVEETAMSVRWGVSSTCLLAVLLVVALFLPTAAAAEEENPILAFVKTKVKHPDKPFTLIVALKVKEGE